MDKQLKQLIKNQIQVTQIPSHFSWGDNRMSYNWDTKRWLVSNNEGQMYNGLMFEDALDQLFNVAEYL